MKLNTDSSFEIEQLDFNKSISDKLNKIYYAKDLWPLVYVLSDGKVKEAYVGETTNAIARMDIHLDNDRKRNLSLVHIITSAKFNKSATLDIESNLIKYLSGDGQFKLLNANAGIAYHNYFDKKQVYWQMFRQIWDKLRSIGLAKHSLDHIDNSDLFKYSPYKALSNDQRAGLKAILLALESDQYRNIVVEGGAGTGKTVLAVFLFKLLKTDLADFNFEEFEEETAAFIHHVQSLRQKFGDPKMALVIPMSSFRKTVQKIFSKVKGLSPRMVIGPSEVANEKYDILLVDESHRLRRRVNLGSYFGSFDKASQKLGLDKNTTSEVEWITLQSRKAIFFYDEKQSIKPSDALPEDFQKLKADTQTRVEKLRSQFRVLGGNGYVRFIDELLEGKFSANQQPFQHNKYEFELFTSIDELVNTIHLRDKECGLSRLIAGYAWKWVSQNDSKQHDIEIEGTKLWWNRESIDWINSTGSVNEVGCIHTTQGYDLNYAGVIFGPEISFDPFNKEIVILKENYHDRNGKSSIKDPEELKDYILNIYKTIMLRGIRGTYVYACDPRLREYLSQFIPHRKNSLSISRLPSEKVQPFINSIPLYNLEAAAGEFSDPQMVEDCDWVDPLPNYRPSPDLFACKVVGESMNRIIPNGSVCLFRKYTGGTRNGRIVLVQLTNLHDPETGSKYTVKQYTSIKTVTGESWEHETIILKPVSTDPNFHDIVLREDSAADLRVLGIFEAVIG
jgi:uncharacterized protein